MPFLPLSNPSIFLPHSKKKKSYNPASVIFLQTFYLSVFSQTFSHLLSLIPSVCIKDYIIPDLHCYWSIILNNLAHGFSVSQCTIHNHNAQFLIQSTYHGLNSVPSQNSYVDILTSMVIMRWGFSEVITLLGWSFHEWDQCLCKRKQTSEHFPAPFHHVDTQGKDSHEWTWKQAFPRHWICYCFDLGLPILQNCEK